ncbi:cysteine hydrolase [Candidatus Woesearchaeota archaeon]|nr:cysteine hydrolase [Candidatus Woesearchaeota archaeon]
MTKILLLIDFINEIVHEDGKLAKRGYLEFIRKNNTFINLKKLIQKARDFKIMIINIKVGFSEDYKEAPLNSPLFGLVKKFNALKLDTWATDFHSELEIMEGDKIIIKHRVSAVYGTQLLPTLRALSVDHVYIAGVATDLAVQTTARELHDMDFRITIVEDCCAAANYEDHKATLFTINKIAEIVKVNDLVFN